MVNIRRIHATETAGAMEPVQLPEVKAWANVDYNDDDSLLQGLITASRVEIENETNLKLVPHTVELFADTTGSEGFIPFLYGTGTGVVVSRLSYAGTLTPEIETADYTNIANGLFILDSGSHKITYSVGAPTSIPAALKQAIKMLVAYRYANRGDQDKQVGFPADIAHVISKYVAIC